MDKNIKFLIIFVALFFIITLTTIYISNKTTSHQTIPVVILEPTISDDKIIRCPADVKKCPDGTYVGRISPRCSFAQCKNLPK
jgi:Pyruvate/2-oxoacid:ferredoxin oxidoreductase delta subunit